ncbi:hypothetical protein PM082_009720 [Marasmius tenuissimus]|nr:hypothetical protein PM082_009720 [Marasmius tenuissimus]
MMCSDKQRKKRTRKGLSTWVNASIARQNKVRERVRALNVVIVNVDVRSRNLASEATNCPPSLLS